VAPWTYCEWAGELSQPAEEDAAVIFGGDRPLPFQFTAWPETVTYHPFPRVSAAIP